MQNTPGYHELTKYYYGVTDKDFSGGSRCDNEDYWRAVLYRAVTVDTRELQSQRGYSEDRIGDIEKKKFGMDVVPALTWLLEETVKECKEMTANYEKCLELLKNYKV